MLNVSENTRKWWILAAMGGVLGIVVFDETVVGVALPTIDNELGLTLSESHWVVNAYLLVFAGLAAAAGRLGDIVGLKRLFVIGVLIFGLASLASGFAESGTWLVSMRAVQGVGAAVIFPASLAIITHAFPPEQRGMAIGIYGAIGTCFLSLGPIAGGFFSELISWRWIFWINPPIVVVIALMVLALWRDPPREGGAIKLDMPGALTLIAGLSLVVFAIMQGPDWGWQTIAIWAALAAGSIVLVLFIIIERRVPQPLIDVVLFKNGPFTAFNLTIFAAQFSKMAVFVFVALYLQNSLGVGALMAGVVLLASTVPTILTSLPAGKLLDQVGARVLVLRGAAASAAAMLCLVFAVIWQSYALLVPALIVWGGCMSFLFVPSLREVMNTVPPDKRGEAGGVSMTAQLLGGTVGMTACSTLFAMTSAYWPIYLVTGCLFLAVLTLGWLTIPNDRPNTSEPSGAQPG